MKKEEKLKENNWENWFANAVTQAIRAAMLGQKGESEKVISGAASIIREAIKNAEIAELSRCCIHCNNKTSGREQYERELYKKIENIAATSTAPLRDIRKLFRH